MNKTYFNDSLNSFGFTIILAGMVGGIMEIIWISVYSSFREPLIKYALRHAGEYQHPVSDCFD